MAVTAPSPPHYSRLLALPAELRELVYRFAVVAFEPVLVTPTSPQQPALLSTCKCIRNEAGPLYYGQNCFRWKVQDFDGEDFEAFTYVYLQFADSTASNIEIRTIGSPSWDNLVAWLKSRHFYNTFLPVMNMEKDDNPDEYVMAGAVQLCEALAGVQWRVKAAALAAFYTGLKGTESEWVKEEDRP